MLAASPGGPIEEDFPVSGRKSHQSPNPKERPPEFPPAARFSISHYWISPADPFAHTRRGAGPHNSVGESARSQSAQTASAYRYGPGDMNGCSCALASVFPDGPVAKGGSQVL